MIFEERSPGLGRRFRVSDHVLGHGPFGDIMTQQKQFGADSRCAPAGVLAGHSANQVTDFAFNSSGVPAFRSAISNANTT